MDSDSPDEIGQVTEIGTFRDCRFEIALGDLASVEADVAVAAMCSQASQQHLGVGIEALDRALRGALIRLRSDGIFSGGWGDTLYLSSLPTTVDVRGVIMLGLGPTGRNTTGKIRRALMVAANQAVRIGADHATFAPAQLKVGAARSHSVATARAVLQGIFDALARPRCSLRRWTFVVPASELEQVADQFTMAFRRIVEH